MICPKCKTEINNLCKEHCSWIISNKVGQMIGYEIRQKIDENTYLLDGSFETTVIFQIIKIPMFEPPLNENQEQRYKLEYKKVVSLPYFFIPSSQEELEYLIPRLLNMKAFL